MGRCGECQAWGSVAEAGAPKLAAVARYSGADCPGQRAGSRPSHDRSGRTGPRARRRARAGRCCAARGRAGATATILPSQALDPDPWYTFSFSPIADSRDRSYFLSVESPDGAPGKGLTLLWFQPAPRGDPYADGAAYKNGQPTKGDLAFGLVYSAPPLQVWTAMLGEAGANTSPLLLYALLFLALPLVILAIAFPYLSIRFPRLAERLKASSLATALAVGLIYGSLFIVIMPPWQGPDEYPHFAYVALLDKHDLNASEVQSLDLFGADRDTALIKVVNASADRNDFIRRLAGNTAPGEPTRTDAFLFQQVRQPPIITGFARWLSAPLAQ